MPFNVRARIVRALSIAAGLTLGLAVARPLAAQGLRGTVEGTVTSRAGAPVAGAVVGAPALGRAVRTDSTGAYRFPDLPVGPQRLEIRAIGFQPVRVGVDVVAAETVRADAVLQPAVVTLPEVVVSTTREQQLAATTPMSVGVVSGEAIREARAAHPSEVVNRSPGVYVSNYGGEGHATAIRQPITTKALYAYLEDGVPIRSTGFFNHNALYEINLPAAGRVEIIKGPGSAVYGSDAVGGVVNAFTRDPSATSTGELFLEGGSNEFLRALGTASTTVGRSGLRLDANVTSSESWRTGTSYQRQSGTLRWDYRLSDRARLKTVATFSHIDQPGDGGGELSAEDYAARPSLVYTPIAYRRVNAARLSTELALRGEQSSFAATLYSRYNSMDLMPWWQLSFDPQVTESRNRSVGLLTRYRRTIAPLRTSLSAGVDVEYSPGSRFEQGIVPQAATPPVVGSYELGDVQYDYDVTFWQAAPYAQADVTLGGNVQLSAGLRYDNLGFDYENGLGEMQTGRWRRPASTDVRFERLSPKLGAAWEIVPNTSVFASYRAAFRAPSESQLFRQGSAVSTVDLEPVVAHSYEAGVRTAVGGVVTFEATGYAMTLENDILTYQDADGLRQTQNAGETRHRGIELGVGVAPVAGLRLDAAMAYARHEYVHWQPVAARPGVDSVDYSGNEMELAPRLIGNARLTWKPAFFGTGSLSAEWVHFGSYWQNPQNTRKYPGHDLFNLHAVAPVTERFELVGRVTNLANTRFAETSSYTEAQGERLRPGAPRRFSLGAQYRFGR
jgi:outer membrane receptor protein involved in Fe transport